MTFVEGGISSTSECSVDMVDFLDEFADRDADHFCGYHVGEWSYSLEVLCVGIHSVGAAILVKRIVARLVRV